MRRFRDQGVVGKAHILCGIRHFEDVGRQNGVATEGNIPGGFADIQALPGLEPLAIGVDQGHQRNLHPKQLLRETRQPVETPFSGGVQQATHPQGMQARAFIGGNLRGLHSVGSIPQFKSQRAG